MRMIGLGELPLFNLDLEEKGNEPKVYRRLVNGADDNVWHFYQVIKEEVSGDDE